MSKKNLTKNIFVPANELESQGVSFTALHTAWEIECFNRVFSRVSIVAKSYREKAITICEEYLEAGWEAFITESRSFFTVWKVKTKDKTNETGNTVNIKVFTPESENLKKSPALEQNKSAKVIAITPFLAKDSASEPKQAVLSTVQEMIAFLEEEFPEKDGQKTTSVAQSQWWHSYIAN